MKLFKQRRIYGGGKRLIPSVTRTYPQSRPSWFAGSFGPMDALELKSFVYNGTRYDADDFANQRWCDFGSDSKSRRSLLVTLAETVIVCFVIENGELFIPDVVTDVVWELVPRALEISLTGYFYMGLTIYRDSGRHSLSGNAATGYMVDYFYRNTNNPDEYEIVVSPNNGRKGLDTVVFIVNRSVGGVSYRTPGSGHYVQSVELDARRFNTHNPAERHFKLTSNRYNGL